MKGQRVRIYFKVIFSFPGILRVGPQEERGEKGNRWGKLAEGGLGEKKKRRESLILFFDTAHP